MPKDPDCGVSKVRMRAILLVLACAACAEVRGTGVAPASAPASITSPPLTVGSDPAVRKGPPATIVEEEPQEESTDETPHPFALREIKPRPQDQARERPLTREDAAKRQVLQQPDPVGAPAAPASSKPSVIYKGKQDRCPCDARDPVCSCL